MFELREAIDDSDSQAELAQLLRQLQEDMLSLQKAFASSMDARNQARALHFAIRLKYYSKVIIYLDIVMKRSFT